MIRVEGGRPGPSENRMPSEDEEQQQQPEKKRPGEEGSLFEEDLKRQKTEDDDDVDVHDFYDGDSEDDKDDDGFMSAFEIVDCGDWKDGTKPDADEKDEDRKCLKVRRCHKYKHAEKFIGLPFFEIFNVKLRLNDKYFKSSVEGPLYGILEVDTTDDPKPIPYYQLSQSQMDTDSMALKLEPGKKLNLPLYGFEFRPLIADDCDLNLNSLFKFKDQDVYIGGWPEKRPELLDDGKGNCAAYARVNTFNCDEIPCRRSRKHYPHAPFISRNLLGKPECSRILIAAYCSLYCGAQATVDVKILKKGVTSCYGFIYARPCIFSTRIRLLSLKSDHNQKLELDEQSESVILKLARSIVAVPPYSSLIIAADLYDQYGEQIVRGKTYFPAAESGIPSKYIKDKNRIPILEVTVKWARKP